MKRPFISQLDIKSLQLYVLIVIIPSIIISVLFTQLRTNQLEAEQTEQAKRIAYFHKDYMDRFIGETMTSIETIALISNPEKESHQYIQSILTRAHQKDMRLSGLYFCDTKGNMLFGSHPLSKQINVYDRNYFQNVLKTKSTTISNAYFGRLTGRYIVTIATPILDSERQIKGVLLASLRLNYMANVMKELTPEMDVQVFDSEHAKILEMKPTVHPPGERSVQAYLNRVPWSTVVAVKPVSNERMIVMFSIALVSSIIATSILFLALKLWLLKRQTAKERAQNEAQKLELVGTLAASTAHEIRNPLTGIKGLITLLSEKYKSEEDQYYFSVIQTEIDRINQIVSEFVILGKPTAEHRQKHDIRHIIEELKPIIESEAHLHHIEVMVALPKEPLFIYCAKDQIKQVLLNLTKNAFDSMATGGILMLSVTKEDHHCLIKVKDTGEGIPPEQLNKIFHPFFTSKDTGTGLGLVVCKRIVDMYGGTISIESVVNRGTEVSVNLPLNHD